MRDAEGGLTTYAYDASGNRTVVIDPVGNHTTSAYDALNREVSRADPLNEAATFAYDAASRMTGTTDRLGRRREFGYDELGRRTTETWYSSVGATVQAQTWAYDAAGNLLAAGDPDGTYTMSYDALNRVRTVAGPFGASMTFSYDAVGNRTLVQDSFGGVTTSTYDAADRLTQREFGGGGVNLRWVNQYTDRDQLSSTTRFHDYQASGSTWWEYDDAGRVGSVTHKNVLGDKVGLYGYAYDVADRLTSKTEDGTTTEYDYDDTDQLTQDGDAAYSYDANGNRDSTGYATGAGNRMTSDGTWTYTYDDEGNLVKKSKGALLETWEYGYDHRNQMVWAEKRATEGGTLQLRVEYAYDAWGNRIERREDADGAGAGGFAVVRYALDGWEAGRPSPVGQENWDVRADLSGSNALKTRRLFGAGVDEAVARVEAGSGTAAWYLADRQGSVRLVAAGSGATILDAISYDGFGQVVSESSPADGDRYKYTGRELDAATGLQYNRARYYDAATGRWTSRDPLGFDAGDANLYRYVFNSATNHRDPSGLDVHVVYFEGSHVGEVGVGGRHLEDVLIAKLKEKLGDAKDGKGSVVHWHRFDGRDGVKGVKAAEDKIREIVKSTAGGDKHHRIVIMGYSWGGDSALRTLDNLAVNAVGSVDGPRWKIDPITIDYFFAIDPVPWLYWLYGLPVAPSLHRPKGGWVTGGVSVWYQKCDKNSVPMFPIHGSPVVWPQKGLPGGTQLGKADFTNADKAHVDILNNKSVYDTILKAMEGLLGEPWRDSPHPPKK